jgi:type I restriction enzyme M protein
MSETRDIVQKLWLLCNVLRDGGMVYHQYMAELTYLLFLKMAAETGTEHALPQGYRWEDLLAHRGEEQLSFYRNMLTHLGEYASSKIVRDIFAFPTTIFEHAASLRTVIDGIDTINWYSAGNDSFGDVYEGLLEKNAVESKSGAGQYFTPRPLIDSIITLMKPRSGETVQDPAAGTGGFLISANRYVQTSQKSKVKVRASYEGVELVKDTYRLCLMNLFVHGMEGHVILGDALSDDHRGLTPADLIVTNPPFGTKKGGGRSARDDFAYPTNNKQFAFLQHVYRALKRGGRAAVVLPDNVLFESNAGKQIRADLMDKCNLHTILRLPTGIFYAQSVKTNVLFFTRGKSDKGNTKEVWVYDLRANMPQFGKRTALTRDHFSEFESAFGDDPIGKPKSLAARKDTGVTGRFRRFTREWIADRGDSLDIAWLKDESGGRGEEEASEPAALAREAMDELEGAILELRGILEELGEEIEA